MFLQGAALTSKVDGFYVVIRGRLRIYRNDGGVPMNLAKFPSNGEPLGWEEINRLGDPITVVSPGDAFGERPFVTRNSLKSTSNRSQVPNRRT